MWLSVAMRYVDFTEEVLQHDAMTIGLFSYGAVGIEYLRGLGMRAYANLLEKTLPAFVKMYEKYFTRL